MECKYWVLAVRWGLDWVETHILRPRFVAVELRSNSLDLDGCETWNGWMWDANIMAWLQHELNNYGTWMDVKRCMEGGMNGSKTHVMIPGWVLDWTWMGKRCSFQEPHEGETWPGWRWDTYIETCIELSCDLDGCETLISRQVSMISTHLHPGDKSPLSKFQNSISVPPSTHINAIQVLSLSKSYLTYIWVLVSTLYTYHLIFIMVPRLSSLLQPFHVSPAS